MKLHSLKRREWILAVGIGILTALLLSAVMVPAFMLGIAPMPEPPSLAFAKAGPAAVEIDLLQADQVAEEIFHFTEQC